jgi:hypothetical protein
MCVLVVLNLQIKIASHTTSFCTGLEARREVVVPNYTQSSLVNIELEIIIA